jgi:hypothetical protein
VKKLFAISLILLLLFNVLGYYAVLLGLQLHNNIAINRLDTQEFNDTETITVKVPLTIPYASNSVQFERVDGVFEYEGEFYRLIKQRLLNDTLQIVCMRDHQSKQMEHALNDYAKTYTDQAPSNQSSGKSVIEINFIKDYTLQTFSFDEVSKGWSIEVLKGNSLPSFISQYSVSITHPPERV